MKKTFRKTISRAAVKRNIIQAAGSNTSFEVWKLTSDILHRLDREFDDDGSLVAECGFEYDPYKYKLAGVA